MSYVYTEEHSLLDLEYLDRGNEVTGKLVVGDLSLEELAIRRERLLGYVRARIPEEFWGEVKTKAPSRQLLKELAGYVEHASRVRELGLGLTLLGQSFGGRTQALYVVCKGLVDRGFSCFAVLYDELIYFAKESWNDLTLKRELDNRFLCDFFVLAEIFGGDDVTASVKQDLVARCSLRRSRNLPTIFSVSLDIKSLNEISSDSFMGRLLFPFARVNKPISIEEVGDVNGLYVERWGLLSGDY